jgi:hypothetical protein
VWPANGTFLLVRWLPVEGFGLPSVALTPPDAFSAAVRQGGAVNRIELSCRGTTISGRINGVTVVSVSDNAHANGQMWFAVGETAGAASTGARARARFSNLVVTQEE